MIPDELDDYERVLDRDEAVVTDLDDERDLSDGEELADVVGERDCTYFDQTRWAYSGRNGEIDGDEIIDVRELKAAGSLLDDPDESDVDSESDD